MDPATVKKTLCDVIAKIQETSGLECPSLTGATIPGRDVKEFKSEVWPYAISMLEDRTGVVIPEDENLFCDSKTKVLLSIDECVERVMVILQKGEKSKAEVEGADYE